MSKAHLPDSLKDLAADARLNIFRIKTHSTLRVQHQEMCPLADCTNISRPEYYAVSLTGFSRAHWGGGSEEGSNFDIGFVFSNILKHFNDNEKLEGFLHLLRSPWFTNYNIASVLQHQTPFLRRQFYHFITQCLIHLCQERVVQNKNSSFPLPRWPCITFLTFPPNEKEVLPGIYFLYSPGLDIFHENIKVTLFEPVLNYLACLINTCPARKESFCTFMNVQKHFGVFPTSQHNHMLIDTSWRFLFSKQDFLFLDAINCERNDRFCHCFSCKKSTVIATIPRYMHSDYISASD